MKKLLLFALSALFIFAACKKGDTGATGANGNNGTNGNANVQGKVLTANGNDWQWDPFNSRNLIVLTDSEITEAIYDSGSVEIYQQTGAAAWLTLPYAFQPAGAPYTLNWYCMHSVGSVIIYAQASDMSHIDLSGTTNYFKVVCIAAGVHKADPASHNIYHDPQPQAVSPPAQMH